MEVSRRSREIRQNVNQNKRSMTFTDTRGFHILSLKLISYNGTIPPPPLLSENTHVAQDTGRVHLTPVGNAAEVSGCQRLSLVFLSQRLLSSSTTTLAIREKVQTRVKGQHSPLAEDQRPVHADSFGIICRSVVAFRKRVQVMLEVVFQSVQFFTFDVHEAVWGRKASPAPPVLKGQQYIDFVFSN